MARRTVSAKDLLKYFNDLLHAELETDDYDVTSILKLAEPDDDGCNWSNPVVTGHGAPVLEPVLDCVRKIEIEARKRFNLIDE